MKKSTFLALLLPFFISGPSYAGASWQTGVIFDHTSVEGALLIRFDPNLTPLPENCASVSSNWMLIPDSRKSIMAVVLLAIAMNNRVMTVYTKGIGPSGYCEVTQVDPEK